MGTVTSVTGATANGFIVSVINSTTNPVLSVLMHPDTSASPVSNGDLVIEATSNTMLTFKYKGSDGVIRVGELDLT